MMPGARYARWIMLALVVVVVLGLVVSFVRLPV
jgi:hypothetical protein